MSDAKSDTKYCGKCGTTKPIACFHRNAMAKDGRQPHCISCRANRPERQRLLPNGRRVEDRFDLRPTREDFRDAKSHGMALALFGIIG